MSMRKISRRQFIRRAAVAGAGIAIVPRHVLGGPGHTVPSETLTRGVIGTGSMGTGAHVTVNAQGKPPVTLAVCDVDKNRLAKSLAKTQRGCKAYSDWRDVIDRKDIDVIHVPTPPHWHALISIAAMQAGKDVYSEKPATKFIREGKALIDTVKRYGKVYSINCYGRGGFEKWRKLVMSGVLGTPLTVRVSKKTGYAWKVKEWSGRTDLKPQPVPPELDYNMWLGPAPWKPYHPHRVHGSFRGYWDYDAGGMGDMGQHWIDPVQYLLGKDDTGPVKTESYAPWPVHPDAVGMWGRITHTYEDGTRIIFESNEWGEEEKGEDADVFIQGPKGRVWKNGRADPEGIWDQIRNFPDPPRLVSFDEAVKTRQKPSRRPDVEAAHRSISLIHLAAISIRLGRTLNWDPVDERVIGDEEANRLVDVPMRAPWHL